MPGENKKSLGQQVGMGCGIALAVFIVVGIIGGMATPDSDRNDPEPQDTEAVADQALADVESRVKNTAPAKADGPEETASKWSYSERKDELRNANTYTARLRSENSQDFGFPYGNDNYLTMTVRKHPQWGRDVYFTIDNGQMMCDIYDCRYSISFDGNVEALTLVPPEDRDSTTLFAKYGPAIIRKLKASDKVIVELQFYREGNRQFVFDTSGLVWEH